MMCDNTSLTRYVAFLRQEGLCTVILEAYVEHLIETDQKRLIAHYVSNLPAPLQVRWYARFLEGEL